MCNGRGVGGGSAGVLAGGRRRARVCRRRGGACSHAGSEQKTIGKRARPAKFVFKSSLKIQARPRFATTFGDVIAAELLADSL